jgi:predicted permease
MATRLAVTANPWPESSVDDKCRVACHLLSRGDGPTIVGAIVATRHGLDPPLVTRMVGVGIVLSFVTLPLWRLVLTWI